MEQNKAKERFTKTWAMEQHRKMWHWIAQEVREGRITNSVQLLDKKKEYIATRYSRKVCASCFMCEYALHEARRQGENDTLRCVYCPLELRCQEYKSDYYMLTEIYDYCLRVNRIAEICERIAEAPERKT